MIKKDVLDVLINIKAEMRERYGNDSEAAVAMTIAHQLAHHYYHIGEEKPDKKKGQGIRSGRVQGKKPNVANTPKTIKAQDIKSGPIAPEGVPVEIAPEEFAMNLGNHRVVSNEEFMEKGGKGVKVEEPGKNG